MKNIQLFSAVILLSLTAFLFSCKKKKVDPPAEENKIKPEQLTVKRWIINGLTSGSLDAWALMVPSCNKDDQYKFRTDDSLNKYDMNKCNVTDPDSTVSFYKIYNNNTQMILKLKLGSIIIDDTADIIELNENALKVNAQYSGTPASISFIHP